MCTNQQLTIVTQRKIICGGKWEMGKGKGNLLLLDRFLNMGNSCKRIIVRRNIKVGNSE